MEARGDLLDTLQGDPYDPEAVRLAYQAVAAVEADLVVHAGAVAREAQKVLREQLAEVNEMIEETREAIDVRFLDFSQDFAAASRPAPREAGSGHHRYLVDQRTHHRTQREPEAIGSSCR